VLGEKHYTVWVVDGWMSMEKWWNDTDRRNWSAGRRHYAVWAVDGWMSMEQWWNGTDRGNWSTGRRHYAVWEVDGWIGMEQWWNYTDRGKLKCWEKTLHSVEGRSMNEYEAMVERYWQEKPPAISTLLFTSFRRTGLGLNPILCGKIRHDHNLFLTSPLLVSFTIHFPPT
jgi:hypothetical protein